MTSRNEIIADLTKKLTDEGRLVEAGWVAFRAMTIPQHVSEQQVNDMRVSFFAGAQHLFGSLMDIMEEGVEPTRNDVNRMELINRELNQFLEQLKAHLAGRA